MKERDRERLRCFCLFVYSHVSAGFNVICMYGFAQISIHTKIGQHGGLEVLHLPANA